MISLCHYLINASGVVGFHEEDYKCHRLTVLLNQSMAVCGRLIILGSLLAVNLHLKLTRYLHRILTRLTEPDYDSGLVLFASFSLPCLISG